MSYNPQLHYGSRRDGPDEMPSDYTPKNDNNRCAITLLVVAVAVTATVGAVALLLS